MTFSNIFSSLKKIKLHNPFGDNVPILVIFGTLISAVLFIAVLFIAAIIFVLVATSFGPYLAVLFLVAFIARTLYFVAKGK